MCGREISGVYARALLVRRFLGHHRQVLLGVVAVWEEPPAFDWRYSLAPRT